MRWITVCQTRCIRSGGTDGRSRHCGIDQRSLEALGPFGTWDRRILAQTVSYLNQGDIRPAVIGLDVLLAGETGTEGDLLLAEGCGDRGKCGRPQQREPLVPLWLQRRTAPFIWMIYREVL